MRRASFIAESIASEPEPEKNTRASGVGVSGTIRSASCSAGAFVNGSKHEYDSIVRICVGDRVGDLRPAVADVAVPQAGHGVDQLVAVAVPQQRALAAGDGDEPLAGGLGERMQEGVGHPSICPSRARSCAGRTDALCNRRL